MPFVLVLIIVACGFSPRIPLSVPELPDAETNRYVITIDGDTSGLHTSTLRKRTKHQRALLELTALTRIDVPEKQSHDSTWLMVQAHDLQPLEAFRQVTKADGIGGSVVYYQDGKAIVKSGTPLGPREAELDVGPGVTDNDLLTPLLRAVDIPVGTELRLKLVVAMAATLTDATITRLEDESATVPAGTFDCRRFEVAVAGLSLIIWYENQGARRMVRYEAPSAGMLMELLPEAEKPVEQP
ncbi:MAG: hypothetical protein JSU73_00670 [candidate division WOR-3 bacterium]|nr:MAG: hypothetical protein JSU73_00670 [candidate division WOR-3 bacterium]